MYVSIGRMGIALLCIGAASCVAAEHRISFAPQQDALRILADGGPLATYVWRDPEILRPYFKDLHAPGGIPVTRRHPPQKGTDPVDHEAMHPGLWLAFGDLGGADFWRNKARVEHVAFLKPPAVEGDKGAFTVRNRYVGGAGAVCEETCTCTFLVRPAGYLLLWDSVFQADQSGFYFGDQEEMGLGIRVATPMMVKPYEGRHRAGRILDDQGRRNEKEIWGRQAAWCDYGGWLDGKFVGITIMPDPNNAVACRWHVRDYGFMAANPFGQAVFQQGPVRRTEVKPGQSLRLRFGILIHAGEAEDTVPLHPAYRDYLQIRTRDRLSDPTGKDPK
jgi:hypothetical protein